MIGHGRIQVGCLAAVGIPALTAFVSGAFLGLLAASVALWTETITQNRWVILFTFSALGMLISWPFSLSFWGRILTGASPDDQGHREFTYTTRIEIVSNEGRTVNPVELPIPPWKLRKFARGALAGKSLAEASWVGADFTRSEFVRFRDALISNGMAEWINPMDHAKGWRLTRTGWAAMRYYAGQGETTPPLEGFGALKVQEAP